ncbi:ribosomal protein S18-alanine N-acetyltransferase [Halobacterium wangiae]|uniref:ribosomal protein S18-alanine N-acetyltransferase n=1 Tax=Halobacterium wangiae TaxID=2902623 RepID=UPI001E5AD2B1|nr:ribosomal protein S18-alanine N-acetyltransferase [Halobacterium wangiae]
MTTAESADATSSIRQATRADLLEVFRIEQSVFPQPWPYSGFERQLQTPGFLVSEASGDGEPPTIVGYVVADTVSNHGRPLGHVKNLAVHPERRGEGMGQALLERGLAVLSSLGVERVKLEVRESNEAARGLYEKYGFEYLRTISAYYADGEDAHVLVADVGDRDAF